MFIRYIVYGHVPIGLGILRKLVYGQYTNVPTLAPGLVQCTNIPTFKPSDPPVISIPKEILPTFNHIPYTNFPAFQTIYLPTYKHPKGIRNAIYHIPTFKPQGSAPATVPRETPWKRVPTAQTKVGILRRDQYSEFHIPTVYAYTV